MLIDLQPLLGNEAVAVDGSVGDEVVEAREGAGEVDDRVGLTGPRGYAIGRARGLAVRA